MSCRPCRALLVTCCFGSRKRHVVLSLTFPRNGSTIHHENISRVGSVGVSVISPICIYPTPQNVGGFVRITCIHTHRNINIKSKQALFVIPACKQKKNAHSGVWSDSMAVKRDKRLQGSGWEGQGGEGPKAYMILNS